MLGAEHTICRRQGAGGRREPQEGLKQQRVERDHCKDRAALDRPGLAPAHAAI